MRDWALGLAALIGWCAVTYGLARLTSPWVWPLSLGLLLLSVVGFRVLAHLAWHGVTTFLPKGRP